MCSVHCVHSPQSCHTVYWNGSNLQSAIRRMYTIQSSMMFTLGLNLSCSRDFSIYGIVYTLRCQTNHCNGDSNKKNESEFTMFQHSWPAEDNFCASPHNAIPMDITQSAWDLTNWNHNFAWVLRSQPSHIKNKLIENRQKMWNSIRVFRSTAMCDRDGHLLVCVFGWYVNCNSIPKQLHYFCTYILRFIQFVPSVYISFIIPLSLS